MERKAVHVRQIKIEACELEPQKLLLTGHLDDERPLGFVMVSGEPLPPGIIHDMTLEVEVSLPDFTITAARASMSQVPMSGCRDVVDRVEVLVGVKIVGGFTREVKRLLGGSRGCAHLVSLLLAMAPIAVQGASAAVQVGAGRDAMAVRGSQLLNSCHMWREDGPMAEQMRAGLKSVTDNGHER